jgi:hypothetical protein
MNVHSSISLLKKALMQAVQKLVPYLIRDARMQGPRWFDKLTMNDNSLP